RKRRIRADHPGGAASRLSSLSGMRADVGRHRRAELAGAAAGRDPRQPDLRLKDDDLRVRGLDPAQVRRTFKRTFGMTFQAYQRACRLGRAMKALHDGAATVDAGMDAGFESDSGFRDAFARVFGDTPGRARNTELLTASWIETPLGPMLAIAGD